MRSRRPADSPARSGDFQLTTSGDHNLAVDRRTRPYCRRRPPRVLRRRLRAGPACRLPRNKRPSSVTRRQYRGCRWTDRRPDDLGREWQGEHEGCPSLWRHSGYRGGSGRGRRRLSHSIGKASRAWHLTGRPRSRALPPPHEVPGGVCPPGRQSSSTREGATRDPSSRRRGRRGQREWHVDGVARAANLDPGAPGDPSCVGQTLSFSARTRLRHDRDRPSRPPPGADRCGPQGVRRVLLHQHTARASMGRGTWPHGRHPRHTADPVRAEVRHRPPGSSEPRT